MKSETLYLLYGIVFSQSEGRHTCPALPPGVDGAPVTLIEEDGLGAAVSWIDPQNVTPDISRLLSYARAVERLHAERVILPMRYGCLLTDECQVAELLRAQREEYLALLRELDGCVEMGVRILLPRGSSSHSASGSESQWSSGRAYLADRAARYVEDAEIERTLSAVAERLRSSLGALARKTKIEQSLLPNRRLSSFYFLVRRNAVNLFRTAFSELSRAEPARLLLSGPWPPYNFGNVAALDQHQPVVGSQLR